MRDKLPKKPNRKECGIINLDTYNGPGTHWVAYYKHNKDVEYYDSFGNLQPPLEVLRYLGDSITYNYKREQQFNTFNCGHLSLNFLIKMSTKFKTRFHIKE